MNNAKDAKTIDGYFKGSQYPSVLTHVFQPSMMAGSLQWAGFHAPDPRQEFSMLDLGCGDAIALCLMAAAYPHGQFVGVDAMPEHIDIGKQFAHKFGITNIELHCQTFDEFYSRPNTSSKAFEFITAQGVIAWVAEQNRERVFDITGRYLAEAGVFAVGYNAQPGWHDQMAMQQVLLSRLSPVADKSPDALQEALEFTHRLSEAGARSIPEKRIVQLRELAKKAPHDYMLHEYLNQHWRPLWFAEVNAALNKRDMQFAVSAGFNRLRGDFTLRKAQRAALETVDDPVEYQVLRDILENTQFRKDLFLKQQSVSAKRERLSDSLWFASTVFAGEEEFESFTPAGKIRFDNAACRQLLSKLQNGPQPYADLVEDGQISTEDLLNALETLLFVGQVVPTAGPANVPMAEQINAYLLSYAKEHQRQFIRGLVTRHGVASVSFDQVLSLAENAHASPQFAGQIGL